MGKPITKSLVDASRSVDDAKWYASNAEKSLAPEILDSTSSLSWEPLGTVACIKPWNFPVEIVGWCAFPALMAGNSIVLKHSEVTPLTGRQIAQLMHEAGVPEDVFVLVEGTADAGRTLVGSSVDCVSFTGSSAAGKAIAQECAKSLKPSVLELGGSTPAVVFEDADLDLALQKVLGSRFGNCGQACSAAKRLVIERSIADDFVAELSEKAAALKIGDPLDPKTEMGPLATFRQRELLEEQVADTKRKGGRLLIGGKRPPGKERSKGAYYEPTIFSDAPLNSAIWREETFGPVLAVRTFKTEQEAIDLANDTSFGLSAQVYSRDGEKASRVAKQIVSGSVFVNATWAGVNKNPWFGVKQSGWGFEGTAYGFKEFSRPKHVFFGQ